MPLLLFFGLFLRALSIKTKYFALQIIAKVYASVNGIKETRIARVQTALCLAVVHSQSSTAAEKTL